MKHEAIRDMASINNVMPFEVPEVARANNTCKPEKEKTTKERDY